MFVWRIDGKADDYILYGSDTSHARNRMELASSQRLQGAVDRLLREKRLQTFVESSLAGKRKATEATK